MNFIYYNVSGVIMEILQFLLSFLLKEYGGEKLAPLINAFKDGNFNIQNLLSCLTPEMIAPILKFFTGDQNNKPCPQNFSGQGYGLNPIAQIADKDIVYTLNKYLSV